MDCALQPILRRYLHMIFGKFQSLFYWINHSNFVMLLPSMRYNCLCFNPYSTGLCISRISSDSRTVPAISCPIVFHHLPVILCLTLFQSYSIPTILSSSALSFGLLSSSQLAGILKLKISFFLRLRYEYIIWASSISC